MLLKEFRLQFPYKVVLISKECIWLWLYSCCNKHSHFSVAYVKQLKYALVMARFRVQYDQYLVCHILLTFKVKYYVLQYYYYGNIRLIFFYLQLSVFSKTTQVHDSESIITSANVNFIFLKSLFHSKWYLWCINK